MLREVGENENLKNSGKVGNTHSDGDWYELAMVGPMAMCP